MELLAKKSQNLHTLQSLGFNVPQFISFQSDKTPDLQNIFPAQSYAVRSAAHIEDTASSSMAGQFQTKLNVPKQALQKAINSLIKDAQSKGLKKSQFSIIIQEFIQPQLSGVVFTRDPLGSQNLIIQYHKGLGEDLVSGKIKPQTLKTNTAPDQTWQKELFLKSRQIEQHFKHPQDIEWCIKNQKLYFLQTRPITTLTKQQYQGHLYIEKNFQNNFYLAQTSLTESVGKTDHQTLALLQDLYAPKGPIHQTYQKFGLKYQPQNFLKILNNQLYVDKELELKTLQPAKTYFATKDGNSQFHTFKGLLTTFLNIYKLSKIPSETQHLQDQLLPKLQDNYLITTNKQFLQDYQLIFQINLLANLHIKNHPHLPELLSCSQNLLPSLPKITTKLKLTGNGLSFSDQSTFQLTFSNQKASPKLKKHFQQNKQQLTTILTLNRLRELARFLTVKNLNQIRPKKIQNYPQNKSIQLPPTISSFPISQKSQLQILSPGKATGPISTLPNIQKGSILLVKDLTPDLTAHFPKISAILSQNGGLLSHLAIMAREHNIPVLSGISAQSSKNHTHCTIDTSQNPPLHFT